MRMSREERLRKEEGGDLRRVTAVHQLATRLGPRSFSLWPWIFASREMYFGEKKALCFFPTISQTGWINILTQQLCDCGWIFQPSELIFSYLQEDNKTCFTGMGESGKVLVTQLCPTLWDPARFLCSWHFSSKNTGVGCHFLLPRVSSWPRDWTQSPASQADSLPSEPLGKPGSD